MIHLSQRDSKWGDVKIGESALTIAADGCTITSISMLSDWFGCYHDPAWMAKNLSFTSAGLLLWNSVTEKMENFKFTWRFYSYQESRILEHMKDPNKAVILQIKNAHWVVGVRKSIFPWSTWYKVVDPWTGNYNWYHSSSITGGATFEKK